MPSLLRSNRTMDAPSPLALGSGRAKSLGIFLALLGLGACAPTSPPPRPMLATANAPAPPDLAEAAHGASLAARHCGACHGLGDAAGPLPDAPPFRMLRARYDPEMMARALGDRLQDLHPRMPPLTMEEDEIADFLTYWRDLSP